MKVWSAFLGTGYGKVVGLWMLKDHLVLWKAGNFFSKWVALSFSKIVLVAVFCVFWPANLIYSNEGNDILFLETRHLEKCCTIYLYMVSWAKSGLMIEMRPICFMVKGKCVTCSNRGNKGFVQSCDRLEFVQYDTFNFEISWFYKIMIPCIVIECLQNPISYNSM
jgi:hypothetical protein